MKSLTMSSAPANTPKILMLGYCDYALPSPPEAPSSVNGRLAVLMTCIRKDELLVGDLDYQDFKRLPREDEAIVSLLSGLGVV